ncbi:MAG: hypothetical protein V4438_03645 [Patescibacteria group bacterium]
MMISPVAFIVAHSIAHIDAVKNHLHKMEFERNTNRKALPYTRPKDRRFLSAFADWFKGSEYKREWLEQIKKFENEPLYCGKTSESAVHLDRLKKTVREVGYGITDAEIYEAKRLGFLPKDATLPKKLSKAEADEWFETITIPTYEKCVEEIVTVPLTCEQKFALISFCHNLGSGNLAKLTMQSGRLADSNYCVISECMLRYCNAGGNKSVGGLIRRREWEAALWRSGTNDYSSEVASR